MNRLLPSPSAANQLESWTGTTVAARIRALLESVWTYRAVRTALAMVFIWSGINKLMGLRDFAFVIDAYGLIPNALAGWAALGLSVLELVAGIGLLLDLRGSLAAIGAMTGLFIGVLTYGIHLGLDVDCGCFGPEDPLAEAFHGLRPALYRDLVMVAGIVYLYRWRWLNAAAPWRLSRLLNRFRSFV